MLPSLVCRQAELESPEFAVHIKAMREDLIFHRKQWEFCYITQVLEERGKLRPGMKGLGFAVGKEPLSELYASRGVAVLATDIDPNGGTGAGVAADWQVTNEHASSLADLNERGLCPKAEFDRLVKFRYVDMNHVPDDLKDFDFLWSACAIEHVGGLDLAKAAMLDMMKCLKPGGVAVHTTEYNVVSNVRTLETGNAIIWRQRDIEEMADRLREMGHLLIPADLECGNRFADHYVDEPPYQHEPHLKLRLGPFVATSVGIIIVADGVRLLESKPPVGGTVTKAPSVWSRLFGGNKKAA